MCEGVMDVARECQTITVKEGLSQMYQELWKGKQVRLVRRGAMEQQE